MNRLRQMSIFAYIVETGSISKAAQKLELSKSVVSQHLKALEQQLGVCLIKRTTRRQTLTPAGNRFYASCKELNLIADSAWDSTQAFQAAPQGAIRITAPHALMDCFVAPVIAELMKRYPKLEPQLIGDDQHTDLMADNIDLAIRVGSSADSNFKQKRLGTFRDVLCGRSELFTQDIDQQVLDIQKQPYIANYWQGEQISHLFTLADGGQWRYSTKAKCMTNSIHSCIALIKAGAGVGILPDFYLKQNQPQIVALLPQMKLAKNVIYAINPFGDITPLAVKVCTEALQHYLTSLELES